MVCRKRKVKEEDERKVRERGKGKGEKNQGTDRRLGWKREREKKCVNG